jgi:hypothetical protein
LFDAIDDARPPRFAVAVAGRWANCCVAAVDILTIDRGAGEVLDCDCAKNTVAGQMSNEEE